MNNFLKEIGLEDAIPMFNYHALEMEYLPRLSEAEIKELLPAIGDRITFVQAIEKLRDRKIARACRRSKESAMVISAPSPDQQNHLNKQSKNLNEKDIVMTILKSEKKLTEKLRLCVIEMISDHVPLAFYFRYRHALSGLNVINFDNGSLNCPFCTLDIPLRYRPNTEKFTWKICNFKRHLNVAHWKLDELKMRVGDCVTSPSSDENVDQPDKEKVNKNATG